MRINQDLITSYIKNEYNNTLSNTFSANYINQRIYNIGAEYGSTGTIKNFKGTTAGATGYIQKQIECPAGCVMITSIYAPQVSNGNGLQLTQCSYQMFDNSKGIVQAHCTVYISYYAPKAITYDCNVQLYYCFLYLGKGAAYTPAIPLDS